MPDNPTTHGLYPPSHELVGQDQEAVGQPWGAFGVLAIFAVVLLDRLLSHTAVITPISPFALNFMRVLGGGAGVFCWCKLVGPKVLAGHKKFVMGLVLPISGGVMGDVAAWRIADHWTFGGSAAAFEEVRYPVVNVKGGGKSHSYSLGVDPFATGEPAEIAIPYAQYQELRAGFAGQCVTLAQRQAPGGAVQIRTRPAGTLPQGRAEIGPCETATAAWFAPD